MMPSDMVFVFGENAIAQRIGKQLADQGFIPVYESALSKKLPVVASSGSLTGLREFLLECANLCQGNGWVHPGVTAWAERPELSSIAEGLGLTVFCPSSRVLAYFGNRYSFLIDTETSLGIPNLILSLDLMHTVREIEWFVRETNQKYPFILRSAKGGGSLGFVVRNANSLTDLLPFWLDQVRKYQGEVILYAQTYLESARQITVPFTRFMDGSMQIFPMVDSSLQTRFKKVIDFCPSVQLAPEVAKRLQEWTKSLAYKCGYIGLGSVEFLVDGTRAYLTGGNARLNTAFPLWEQVAGTQAVAWQISALTANREFSSQKRKPDILPRENWTHGMALRIYAEDSSLQLPQAGEIFEMSEGRLWIFPGGRVEADMNYSAGSVVSVDSSGLLGVLWVSSDQRARLFPIAQSVLQEIWISGSLQTNEKFLSELLSHPWVREEIFHTAFIDEEFLPNLSIPNELLPLCTAVLVSHPQLNSSLNLGDAPKSQISWVVDGSLIPSSPEMQTPAWEIEASHWVRKDADCVGEECRLGGGGQIHLESGAVLRTAAFPFPLSTSSRWLVRIGQWFVTVRSVFNRKPKRKRSVLLALVTGRVHAILYREGVLIPPHQPVLIVEVFGEFIPHAFPVAVQIKDWKIAAEDLVIAGQELAELGRVRESKEKP